METNELIKSLRKEPRYSSKATLEIMDLCFESADRLQQQQKEIERLKALLETYKHAVNQVESDKSVIVTFCGVPINVAISKIFEYDQLKAEVKNLEDIVETYESAERYRQNGFGRTVRFCGLPLNEAIHMVCNYKNLEKERDEALNKCNNKQVKENKKNVCKWCHDDICVNDSCPYCADYCPDSQYFEICKYME